MSSQPAESLPSTAEEIAPRALQAKWLEIARASIEVAAILGGTALDEITKTKNELILIPGGETPMPATPEQLRELTDKQLDVLGLASLGLSNREISERLYVTEHTAKYHLSDVYRTLGVKNRTEAAVIAHEAGLFEYAINTKRRAFGGREFMEGTRKTLEDLGNQIS